MPQLANQKIGAIGFGLMGLTWKPQPPPQEEAFAVMRAALDSGSNCWNGGEFYGTPDYNSLVLLERYFEKFPEDADRVVINIKGGNNPDTHRPEGSPENTRRSIDDCMAQLKGRKKIDLFEFARRDPNVPLEVTLGTIEKEYVQTGKIGGVSLSEVRAETIHEAVKHTKILGVEVEFSLFSTEILHNGVAAACAQYEIPIIAYSPIGRGMLTGQLQKYEDIPKDSLLLSMDFPRFRRENFEINMQLVKAVEEIAGQKGCTPAQLAINWTRAMSKRPGMPVIVPIPGSSSADRARENSKVIDLTDEEMGRIDEILAKFTPAGSRYFETWPVDT